MKFSPIILTIFGCNLLIINTCSAEISTTSSTFKFTPTYFPNNSTDYSTLYYDSNGKPRNLVATPKCQLDKSIIDKVMKFLPEGKSVPKNAPSLLTDDRHANIYLSGAATDVQVAYVFEGAGYTNSVGFFNFRTDISTPLNAISLGDKILFPNFSGTGTGGTMNFGDWVSLGPMAKDTAIGFTLVSNGWKSGKVDANRTVNQIFRTVSALNPESTSDYKRHTVLLSDPNAKILVIGIEDLNRQSCSNNDWSACTDDDFNDVILAVCVDPWTSVDCSDCTTIDPPVAKPGVSGPSSWTEVTESLTENDPIKAQKAKERAANH